MHETAEELAELQRLLDASHAAANSHMASIFTPERRASAAETAQLLRGACVLALATVSPDGSPRTAPVDGLFFRGRFTFSTSPESARMKNIRRDARVSANYNRGEELCVIVHGAAREIDQRSAWGLALRDYNREVYGEAWDSWGYWGKAPYTAIEPSRMYAALFNRALLGA
ncbi:MAG: pyridoxamine 5'-phosphate oxidase family protein [Deltaproteobacteria bacterium]|nr:pyridoxamine 5'-phosphate oxidase family protein [Deltaproteobacteria bacterium]